MIAPLGSALVELAAAIHAASFPPAESWSAAFLAGLLATRGTEGWLDDRGGMILFRHAAGEAELLTLAVLPDRRRQGVARSLLASSLAALAAAGTTRVFLEVAADNAAALALYRHAGFAPIGNRPNYYAPGRAAILMARG